jgi:hypothetical protein
MGFGLGQGGQEHGRQNGDDGNDHQQFNQGETPAVARAGCVTHSIHGKNLISSFTSRFTPANAAANGLMSLIINND